MAGLGLFGRALDWERYAAHYERWGLLKCAARYRRKAEWSRLPFWRRMWLLPFYLWDHWRCARHHNAGWGGHDYEEAKAEVLARGEAWPPTRGGD